MPIDIVRFSQSQDSVRARVPSPLPDNIKTGIQMILSNNLVLI